MCEFCDMYLYAKENARELKKETGINTYFNKEDLEKSVVEYEKNGFKVYYNS